MNKKITVAALAVLMILATTASAVIQVQSVEIRGSVAFGNSSWDNSTFAGFFYDVKDNLGKEKLEINLTADAGGNVTRTIGKDNLVYSTQGEPKTLQVVEKQYSGNAANAVTAGLEQFANGSMAGVSGASGAGQYTIVGWMADKYIAIKKKPYKLGKLLVEHGSAAADKKTLTVGETWDIGAGYSLTANSIDAKASPRQVWLTLSKDGVKKDDKVITAGTSEAKPVYTFVEKSLCGETDVPVFLTYVDSVFAGATTDMVQLRYTWLMSSSCTEIKSGDTFGIMKVSQQDPIILKNSDNTVTLSPDTTVNVMGEVKLKVADDANNLRYYPYAEYQVGEPGETTPPIGGTTVATTLPGNTTVPPTTVAGTTGATTVPPATTAPVATTQPTPGFEAVFAIAGLLAVAFLVLRQRK